MSREDRTVVELVGDPTNRGADRNSHKFRDLPWRTGGVTASLATAKLTPCGSLEDSTSFVKLAAMFIPRPRGHAPSVRMQLRVAFGVEALAHWADRAIIIVV